MKAYSKTAISPMGDAFASGVMRCLTDYLGCVSGDSVLWLLAPDTVSALPVARSLAELSRDLGISSAIECQTSETPFEPERFKSYSCVVHASRTESLFRNELLEHLRRRSPGAPTHFRMFGFSVEIFEQCFNVPKLQLEALNASLVGLGVGTRIVRVCSEAGTDLTITLDPQVGWTTSFGHFDGAFPGVLPPSEVNTFSSAVSGVLVADGAINASLPFPGDVRLDEQKCVTATIEDGRVTSWNAPDPLLRMMLTSFFTVPNATRVGEIGIGTNVGMTAYVPFVSHINERWPGFHLGLGTPTRGASEVGWTCPFHLDLILRECSIWFDEVLVCQKGHFMSLPFCAVGDIPPTGTLYVDAV